MTFDCGLGVFVGRGNGILEVNIGTLVDSIGCGAGAVLNSDAITMEGSNDPV